MSFMPRTLLDRKVDNSSLGHPTNDKVNGLPVHDLGSGNRERSGTGLLQMHPLLVIQLALETISGEGK